MQIHEYLELTFKYLSSWLLYKRRLRQLTGAKDKQIEILHKELLESNLYTYIQNEISKVGNKFLNTTLFTERSLTKTHVILPNPGILHIVTLYVICRFLRPDVVIETGVANGVSSLIILNALHMNNKGLLYSIDVPDSSILPSRKDVGWLVPQKFRDRWKLIFGRSSEILPPLLNETKNVDVFFHDSEHTYNNMIYEYRTVWPFIRKGGILLSDDIIRFGKAFQHFTSQVKRPAYAFYRIGAVKK